MKTEIYENYGAFLNRPDKSINGVTKELADADPNWNAERSNEGCWNCSRCSRCSRCSHCYRCSHCSDCSRCSHCSHCSRCSHCSHCSDCYRCSCCSDCSRCSHCYRCSDVSGTKNTIEIPLIHNIHTRLMEVVTSPENTLDMGDWHKCETTHCRAGWVVTLAGEAGKKLEKDTSTEFAAMQIYAKSSPILVSPVRFYETTGVAMADILRCADEESKL